MRKVLLFVFVVGMGCMGLVAGKPKPEATFSIYRPYGVGLTSLEEPVFSRGMGGLYLATSLVCFVLSYPIVAFTPQRILNRFGGYLLLATLVLINVYLVFGMVITFGPKLVQDEVRPLAPSPKRLDFLYVPRKKTDRQVG